MGCIMVSYGDYNGITIYGEPLRYWIYWENHLWILIHIGESSERLPYWENHLYGDVFDGTQVFLWDVNCGDFRW